MEGRLVQCGPRAPRARGSVMRKQPSLGMTMLEVVVALGLFAIAASTWSASVAIHAKLTYEAQEMKAAADRLRDEAAR